MAEADSITRGVHRYNLTMANLSVEKKDRLTKNYKHIEYEICSGGGEDVHIKKGTPR